MQDGLIVHDEQTEPGKVPARARRLMYELPKTTEEDDLAGVSALMAALPSKDGKASKAKKSSKKTKRAKKPKKVTKSPRSRKKAQV